MIVEIDLTPELLRQWENILREYRIAPREEALSTPELFASAMKKEDRLAGTTLRKLFIALISHKPASLDCTLIVAIDDLQRAHDRARAEGR